MELTVLDPRTGDTVARVPIADAAACDNAVARARAASLDWARTTAAERAAAVAEAAAAVRAAADELAELNELETGKLRYDALGGGGRRRHAAPVRAARTAASRRESAGCVGRNRSHDLDEMTAVKVVHWSPPN